MSHGRKKWGLHITLCAVLCVGCVLSICVGSTRIPLLSLWSAAIGRGDPLVQLVLWELRLPRLILTILVGGSLGLSGAAMQGLLRNPLVEPGLLGVSAGAGLGAVAVFYSGATAASYFAMPIGGMGGALGAVLLVISLARWNTSIQSLILAGVSVSAFCAAATSLILNLFPNPYAGMEIVFWMLGSVSDRSMNHVLFALPFIGVGSLLLFSSRNALRALSLGEDVAQSLGYSVQKTRWQIILGSSLAVGASVAITGSIGFIGLIVSHVLRPFVKGDPARLLTASAFGGAILLLIGDLLVRIIPTGQELKVGVVTALVGAPLFFVLLIKSRGRLP
jgi:iron complex transport system permease protein